MMMMMMMMMMIITVYTGFFVLTVIFAVKNEWSYTTLPPRLHGVHREEISLLLGNVLYNQIHIHLLLLFLHTVALFPSTD
jgi:hypothetical protein